MPPAERGTSRLLRLGRQDGAITHHAFADLPALLEPGDVLVVNDTRVFPARLIGQRLPGGGAAECFLVRPADEPGSWVALVHPGQRLKPGSRMRFERDGHVVEAEVVSQHFHGRRVVRLWTPDGSPVHDAIHAVGHMPLPPYVKRDDTAADRERYQTVYARVEGSIAAPDRGPALHARVVRRPDGTRHRARDRDAPRRLRHLPAVRAEQVDEHQMEAERYDIPPATAALLTRALRERRRIVAVGTTTTRTLESLVRAEDGAVQAQSGETALFIRPGHEFKVVSGLVTNFHLPRSSLLMLVSALAGREHVLAAYREAIDQRYRFYSYGDAMVVL